MPYTKKDRRLGFEGVFAMALPDDPTGGDLASAIAELIEDYRWMKGDSWQTFSDIDGAVNGALREFKINVVDPYEAQKKVKNGPIFAPVKRGTL